MIIGIIGSRRRNETSDKQLIETKLINLINDYGVENLKICSGGCPKGGDKFAEELALKYRIPKIIYKADWNKNGRIAGFIRNTYIAETSDILIACVASDRKGGTEDTIKKFKKMKPNGEIVLV